MLIDYTTILCRKDMAEFVARCMGTRQYKDLPYKPNKHDNTFWTLDIGNDWKVKFFPDEPNTMEIIHRYGNKEAIKALASWVAYRTGGKLRD